MKKKRKCNTEQRPIILNSVEIDYDKLADAIVKGIMESTARERQNQQRNEVKKQEEWDKKIGFIKHTDGEKFIKRKWVEFLNGLIALKAFIFYKKEYTSETRFSFEMMQMICTAILYLICFAFLGLSILIIVCVAVYHMPIWILSFLLITLFFARFVHIISMEIEQMQNNEMINMIFSSLMAFIAALFTVLAFIRR